MPPPSPSAAMLMQQFTDPFPIPPPPRPPAPPDPGAGPSAPPPLSPWAWTVAVIFGQPNAHRLVRAFFLGLIGLASVLIAALRGCRS